METQQIYLNSLDKVMDMHVDVVLPSHATHPVDYNFYAIADADDGTGNGFIDPTAWKRMVTAKKMEMLNMMEKEKEMAS